MEQIAIFGGQGTNKSWWQDLNKLKFHLESIPKLIPFIEEVTKELNQVGEKEGFEQTFKVKEWIYSCPSSHNYAPISCPMITLTQLLSVCVYSHLSHSSVWRKDLFGKILSHSFGVFAALPISLASSEQEFLSLSKQIILTSFLIGLRQQQLQPPPLTCISSLSTSPSSRDKHPLMLLIKGIEEEEVRILLSRISSLPKQPRDIREKEARMEVKEEARMEVKEEARMEVKEEARVEVKEEARVEVKEEPSIQICLKNSREAFVVTGISSTLSLLSQLVSSEKANAKVSALEVTCSFHSSQNAQLLKERLTKDLIHHFSSQVSSPSDFVPFFERRKRDLNIPIFNGTKLLEEEDFSLLQVIIDFFDCFADWSVASSLLSPESVLVDFGPGSVHKLITREKKELQVVRVGEMVDEKLSWEEKVSHVLSFYPRKQALDSMDASILSEKIEKMLQVEFTPVDVFNFADEFSLRCQLLSLKLPSPVPFLSSPLLPPSEPIAIVGYSKRFPSKSKSATRMFNNSSIPVHHPLPAYFLQDIDLFDEKLFNLFPREVVTMDPGQRLLLECTYEAFEDAAIPFQREKNVGVFMGKTNSDYVVLLDFGNSTEGSSKFDYYSTNVGNNNSVASGRISFLYAFNGPCITLDTACSSSLVSLHLACKSLLSNECSIAVVGAVNIILNPKNTENFHIVGMLSPDGECKTFDASANGYVRSEGCGVLILKKLSQAIKDKDNIRAIVSSTALNHCGKSNGITAPNGIAQQSVIREALSKANLTPNDIQLIEAHGTGTSLGDPIEMQSIKSVFGDCGRSKENPLVIHSVKTRIGHCEIAAGMAGLVNVIESMEKEMIPKHLHFKTLNPHISPLQQIPAIIPHSSEMKWKRETNKKRRAGVSSFGYNGTNAHAILTEPSFPQQQEEEEEKEPTIEEVKSFACCIFKVCASDLKTLSAFLTRYSLFFQSLLPPSPLLSTHKQEEEESRTLLKICFTSNIARSTLSHTLAFGFDKLSQLKKAVSTLQQTLQIISQSKNDHSNQENEEELGIEELKRIVEEMPSVSFSVSPSFSSPFSKSLPQQQKNSFSSPNNLILFLSSSLTSIPLLPSRLSSLLQNINKLCESDKVFSHFLTQFKQKALHFRSNLFQSSQNQEEIILSGLVADFLFQLSLLSSNKSFS